MVKNLPANAGGAGSIPGSGRSSDEENGNPLQYSCLENTIDRGAWQATVYGVIKLAIGGYNAGDLGSIPGLGRSQQKGKANHSSILVWKIPGTA